MNFLTLTRRILVWTVPVTLLSLSGILPANAQEVLPPPFKAPKGAPNIFVFYYNLVGVERTSIDGKETLAPGKHSIELSFKYDGGGIGKGGLATLTVDGKKVAEQKLTRTIPFRVSAGETLDIGEDTGTPVSEDYHVPFKFTGKLNKVVVRLAEAAALTPEEQKQLDEQEGANEVID